MKKENGKHVIYYIPRSGTSSSNNEDGSHNGSYNLEDFTKGKHEISWWSNVNDELISKFRYARTVIETFPSKPNKKCSEFRGELSKIDSTEKLRTELSKECVRLFPSDKNRDNFTKTVKKYELTPTETVVLWLRPYFESNISLAYCLGNSPKTIEKHFQGICKKFKVGNSINACVKAVNESLMPELFYSSYRGHFVENLKSNPITKGQLEVWEHVSSGLTDREIALNLNTSLDAVDSRRTKLYRKLGVVNRTQAAVIYILLTNSIS